MQPQLTTRDGNTIPLTDDIYEMIVNLVNNQSDLTEPAASIEELEVEFSDLFEDALSTDNLLAERAEEIAREHRKLERFD